MKKTVLIFLSLMAAFLLIMLPSAPAVEYKTVREDAEKNLLTKIQDIKEWIKDNPDKAPAGIIDWLFGLIIDLITFAIRYILQQVIIKIIQMIFDQLFPDRKAA